VVSAPAPLSSGNGIDGPRQAWPAGALEAARELQHRLAIGDRDWHALKSQRPRRAAEQLASALVLLLAADRPAAPLPTPARQQAIDLLEHALAWLKADISDPGCPSHGR
jgi:hypothetical protein